MKRKTRSILEEINAIRTKDPKKFARGIGKVE